MTNQELGKVSVMGVALIRTPAAMGCAEVAKYREWEHMESKYSTGQWAGWLKGYSPVRPEREHGHEVKSPVFVVT